jgi:hypothetical protein
MKENTIDFVNKLIEKSTEAFIMGLEIYNKPTIKYRVKVLASSSAMLGN